METLFAFDMVLLSLEQVIIRKPGMIKGGFEDERGLYIFPVVSCVLSRSFLGKLLMQRGLPTKQMNINQADSGCRGEAYAHIDMR